MKKIIDFLKSPLAFPVMVIGGVYLFWLFTAPMGIRSIDDNFGNYLAGLMIFGIYIFIVAIEYHSEIFPEWSPAVFLLSISIDILAVQYVVFFLYEISNFGWTESVPIFVTGITLTAAYPVINILSKRENKNRLSKFLLFIAGLPILGANIAYAMNFYPEKLETVETDKYKYYVTSSYDWEFHSYQNFYKCKKWSLSCQSIYFSYSLSLGPIIIDDQNREINLLGYGATTIFYTDGEHPRTYTGPSTQFQDHMYQFSDECNNFNNEKGYYSCDSYTYKLYKCNPDYKSCDPLPIQYTQDYDILLIIEGNEETKELNIYDDYPEEGGILIASYGKNPRCYVEGCEILEVK